MKRDTTPPPSREDQARRPAAPTSPPLELDDDKVEFVSWDAPLVPPSR
jgi:hypothetical protein